MSYAGMTVNERLYIGGYLKEFDNAIKNKDKDRVIEILKKVDCDNKTIESILDKYNLYHTKYKENERKNLLKEFFKRIFKF